MNSIALLTTLGFLHASEATEAPCYAYMVLKQPASTSQQSGVFINAGGEVFAFATDDVDLRAVANGAELNAVQLQTWLPDEAVLMETESRAEMARVARATAMVSNETLTPRQQQDLGNDDVLFVSIDSTQRDSEPVIIFQDGRWRRDNAADEARIVKAYLLNKARKYLQDSSPQALW